MKSISPGRVLGFFECKHCGAQLGSFVYIGSTCLDHYEYQSIHVLGNESYYVQEIMDDYGYLKELRITNPMNMIEHLERESQNRKQLDNRPARELLSDFY